MKNIDNQSTSRRPGDWNVNKAVVIIILCYVLIYCIGVVIAQRNFIFDDSFITYRYSKNLAQGYGITWNPNEHPVEGYTNYLLVVVLAPFIRLGIAPLLVTRVLSLVCAGLMFFLLVRISRENYQTQTGLDLFIPAFFLLVSNTIPLSMVGLETVLFTTTLFFSFILGGKFLKTEQMRFAYFFGFFAFIAFLFRPEALLLLASFGCVVVINCWRKSLPWKVALRFLKAITISFVIPILVYLIWKYVHFGTIIPNSFLLKVPGSGLFSPNGLASVLSFMRTNFIIILTGLFSFAIVRNDGWQRAVAVLFCILYSLFYVRVDTLMDIYHRFMYPSSIFLMFLSIPTFKFVFQYIHFLTWNGYLKVTSAVMFIFLFTWNPLRETMVNIGDIVRGQDRYSGSNVLMQREYRAALALRQYPNILVTRIAFGDTGVIPFYTGALSLDTVGLNDRFIARERDLRKLTDYFFNQQPDLILHPANQNFSWIKFGHGHMGNLLLWSTDVRWDGYAYIGTIKTDNAYDIHIFLRRDWPDFAQFKSFLQDYVTDGTYAEFPIAVGSYVPTPETQPVWIFLPAAQR